MMTLIARSAVILCSSHFLTIISWYLLLTLLPSSVEGTTPSPSISCGPSESLVQVFLTTDNRPLKISWSVYDTDTGEQILGKDDYTSDDRNEDFKSESCVDPSLCLEFTISKTGGGGICCEFGEGEFTVTYDGAVVAAGGDNFDTEYTSSPFGCSIPCIDSTQNIAPFGGDIDCEQIQAAGKCGVDAAKSHCPLTCSACSAYQCADTVIDWRYDGRTYSCSMLDNLSEDLLRSYCAEEFLYSTCREKCDYCLPISTDVPTISPIDSPSGTSPPNSGEVYLPNPTGDISYQIMQNRNPDCTAYIGDYFATIFDHQEDSNLEASFEITVDDTHCIFTSNNIPNHDVGADTTNGSNFADAVEPNVDDYTLRVTRNPEKQTDPVYIVRQGGKITLNAIMLNGVDLDMDSAFCYDPSFGGSGIGLGCLVREPNWFAIPAANPNVVTLDAFTGHSYFGRYHYHGENDGLSEREQRGFFKNANVVGDNGSPVIGFAPDGFPIYGHYFYDVASGTVRMATSSWRIKVDYLNGREDIGTDFDPPSIDDYELGLFEQDWEYVEGSGDLDECNGLTDAFGNYGYYYTIGYPYGPVCTYGEPNESFTKEGCEYNPGGNQCRQFSFVTYSKEGENAVHDHDHDHGSHASGAAQARLSVIVLLLSLLA